MFWFNNDLFFLSLVTGMASSIRLMSVSIPPHAIRGQDVKLECLYDMEGDKLYSIKWYRNGHEFYRYIPTDRPSTAIFDGNGIKVDVSNQLYGMIEYQYDTIKVCRSIWSCRICVRNFISHL